jgi:serine/threonine-protein kinase
MRIVFAVIAGAQRGRVFTFTGHDTFLVGRSHQAHFQLASKDRYCSRFHFMVEVNPPRCRIIDLDSNNGTHVNGRKVRTAELKNGDEVRAGRSVLRVSVEPTEEDVVEETALWIPPDWPANDPSSAGSPGVMGIAFCPGCGSAMRTDAPKAPAEDKNAALFPLCPACELLASQQPQPIPGYRIVRQLGRGGMGVVYLAVHKVNATARALKTIQPGAEPNPVQVRRFLREASILRELDHPNIVAFHDLGTSKGLLYFAMDLVRGRDLKSLLKVHESLPVGRAVGWACQVLQALEYAHARKFVHRDIKPENVMVVEVEGAETAKLVDFGLARVYQASRLSGLTLTGEIGGTPAYVAPEQVLCFREALPASDLYSLAATLYHLLTGKLTYDFTGEPAQRFLKVLNESPVPIRKRRADLPVRLAEIIQRCLRREPSARFPDAACLRTALLPFCSYGS